MSEIIIEIKKNGIIISGDEKAIAIYIKAAGKRKIKKEK